MKAMHCGFASLCVSLSLWSPYLYRFLYVSPPFSHIQAGKHIILLCPPLILGVLIGLHPFHSYTVTLTACSRAGCTESSQALSISTPQEGKVISKVLTSTFQS